MKNSIEKGFLNRYKTGRKGEITFLPLGFGAVRLEYSRENGSLLFVSFVIDEYDQSSIGERLEFDFIDSSDPNVTFISQSGVSGLQWKDGVVYRGNTYDEGEDKTIKVIKLEDWIDECIERMINPPEEFFEEEEED